MLERSVQNPIITAADLNYNWCSIKVYNPSVIKNSNGYQMLFRAVGKDWVSRIGIARSSDGVNFEVHPEPALVPIHNWERAGCEDPRVTKIDETYWLTYTAFDGITARAGITSSLDLETWDDQRVILFPQWHHTVKENCTPDWSKGAAMISQPIDGRYYMLFGDSHIWPATSTNLMDWEPSTTPIISRRPGLFDASYVETGPPPILTDRGWLVIYHGVDQLGPQMTYRIGAALLEPNDPTKVVWRSKQPILEPTESYETVGFVDVIKGGFETLKKMTLEDLHQLSMQQKLPKAVFCCGAVKEESGSIRLYYGAGDTVICTATIDLDTIFQS